MCLQYVESIHLTYRADSTPVVDEGECLSCRQICSSTQVGSDSCSNVTTPGKEFFYATVFSSSRSNNVFVLFEGHFEEVFNIKMPKQAEE